MHIIYQHAFLAISESILLYSFYVMLQILYICYGKDYYLYAVIAMSQQKWGLQLNFILHIGGTLVRICLLTPPPPLHSNPVTSMPELNWAALIAVHSSYSLWHDTMNLMAGIVIKQLSFVFHIAHLVAGQLFK